MYRHMITATNIKRLKAGKGYTSTELARLLDIQTGYLSQVEKGVKGVSPKMKKKLCEVFGCSVDELYKNELNIPEMLEPFMHRLISLFWGNGKRPFYCRKAMQVAHTPDERAMLGVNQTTKPRMSPAPTGRSGVLRRIAEAVCFIPVGKDSIHRAIAARQHYFFPLPLQSIVYCNTLSWSVVAPLLCSSYSYTAPVPSKGSPSCAAAPGTSLPK